MRVPVAALLLAAAVLSTSAEASASGRSAVRLSLTDSPDPAAVGAPLTYTATVTNTRPGVSAGVTLYFEMRFLPADPQTHQPASPEFVSGTTSTHGCRLHDDGFICPLGRLPAKAVVTARFVVVPKLATMYRAQFAGGAYTHVQGEPYSANSDAVQQTMVRS